MSCIKCNIVLPDILLQTHTAQLNSSVVFQPQPFGFHFSTMPNKCKKEALINLCKQHYNPNKTPQTIKFTPQTLSQLIDLHLSEPLTKKIHTAIQKIINSTNPIPPRLNW